MTFFGQDDPRLLGVDTSPEMLGLAREKVPEGEFYEADLHDVPLASAGVIPYVAGEPPVSQSMAMRAAFHSWPLERDRVTDAEAMPALRQFIERSDDRLHSFGVYARRR